MIEDKACNEMKYFYLINLFCFSALNLGFIRSRLNGRRNSTVSSRNNLEEIFVISLISHLSLRDIKSAISGSTLYQIDHLRQPRRIPNKIRNENIFFVLQIISFGWLVCVGWSELVTTSVSLRRLEMTAGSSSSQAQLRTDWLRPTDEQSAPLLGRVSRGERTIRVMVSVWYPPALHTTHHQAKQLITTQRLHNKNLSSFIS